MKKIFFKRAHQPFLLLAMITFSVAILFKGAHPESMFDVSIYNHDVSIISSRVWFLFSGYLLLLSGLYYILNRAGLKTRRWLVILHYSFIALFLVFFAMFSSFANPDIKALLAGVSWTTLVTIYGVIFLIDFIFFALGNLFFLINILTLKKEKKNNTT
jgi:hypothetical protein